MSISPSVLSFDSNIQATASAGASASSAFGALSGLLGSVAEFSSVLAETSTAAGTEFSAQADGASPLVSPCGSTQLSAGLFTTGSATTTEGDVGVTLPGPSIVPTLMAQVAISFSAAVYQSNVLPTVVSVESDVEHTLEPQSPAIPASPTPEVVADVSAEVDSSLCLALATSGDLALGVVRDVTAATDVAVDTATEAIAPVQIAVSLDVGVQTETDVLHATGGIHTETPVDTGIQVTASPEVTADLSTPFVSTVAEFATAPVSIPIRFSVAVSIPFVTATVDATVSEPVTVNVDPTPAVDSTAIADQSTEADVEIPSDSTETIARPATTDLYSAALAMGLGVVQAPLPVVVDRFGVTTASVSLDADTALPALTAEADGSVSHFSSVTLGVTPTGPTDLNPASATRPTSLVPASATVAAPVVVGDIAAGFETTFAATATLGNVASAVSSEVSAPASVPVAESLVQQTAPSASSATGASTPTPAVTVDSMGTVTSVRFTVPPVVVQAKAATTLVVDAAPVAAQEAAVVPAGLPGKIPPAVPASVESQVAAVATAKSASDSSATVQEKFAADLAVRRAPRNAERSTFATTNKKSSLVVDNESVVKASSVVGTEAANPVAPMVHDIRQTRFASLSGEGLMPASGVGQALAGVPQHADREASAASNASAAVQAVQQITDAADVLVSTDRSNVHLKLKLDDVGVAVNVEYRNGEVRATFHTDSTELRDALSAAWQTHASAVSEQKPYRFAEPVYASASMSSDGSGSATSQGGFSMGGDTPRQFSQSSQSEAAAQATFAASSRHRLSVAAAATVSARPVVATTSTLRLEAFA